MPAPFNKFTAVTPSNTVDLPVVPEAIWIGAAGAVVVVQQDGTAVTIAAVPAGGILPISPRRINATGTTATSIVALNSV